MNPTTRSRYGALAVAVAPAVMFVALVAHPFIARLPDVDAVASAAQANQAMWAAVHLLTMFGVALTALAFLAIRAHLRDAGENRYAWALPWLLFGSVLYAVLPGLEFTPFAVARIGGDVAAAQQELVPVFVPVLAISSITFAIGAAGFAKAVLVSGVLVRPLGLVVATALIVLALSRFVPLGAVQFYVQAAAGLVALWPLALHMWRGSVAAPVARNRTATVR